MVEKAIEEYALASAEAAYEDPGEHVPMVFLASGVGFHYGNYFH